MTGPSRRRSSRYSARAPLASRYRRARLSSAMAWGLRAPSSSPPPRWPCKHRPFRLPRISKSRTPPAISTACRTSPAARAFASRCRIPSRSADLTQCWCSVARNKLRRISVLSVVIVSVCGRSSNHRKSDLARLCLTCRAEIKWMPRLKRGMTTENPLVIVRVCGRSSNHRKSDLARLCLAYRAEITGCPA